jgi:hypothetical protein
VLDRLLVPQAPSLQLCKRGLYVSLGIINEDGKFLKMLNEDMQCG